MRLTLYVFATFLLAGCTIENEESTLKVDHVNIWVQNPKYGKEKLEEIGFTSIPDSLCKVHAGQGTTGRYFYFLNAYLELIFIHNEEEFQRNVERNRKLDFVERANSPQNGFSPFSVALKMADYDKESIPFETVEYQQEWMGESNRIFAARNSKFNKAEPSLFVVYPEIEYDTFESMEDLSIIPEEYSMWREFYKHKNGAEKISKIRIHSNEVNHKSETVKMLKAIKEIELVEGEAYLMEIYFDDQRKNEVYDMRPEIPLKIYL